ncbi:zinc finger protein 662-like isoform X8 [Acanthopagrus latus]|uniref:zinc finger protein 662-like isoform X8 n=1 Tax=Acanthopagrus latus TaxID=8177 RepID=UPI00187C1D1B|nr:zinc finger protein 662-like isoform X8 [Acanthopagrus latus]
MSKVQTLRVVVKQRLTAAAEEIFELFERTIAEYEEELCRHRKLLDAVFQPQVQLHRTVQTFTPVPVKSEEDEEEPQSSQLHHIKPEEIRHGEHLKTEAGVEDCGGPEPVKDSDPDRYLQPKEIDGARQLKMDVQFSRAVSTDVQQLLVIKEEVEWSSSLNQDDPPALPQEELWTRQDGEQLRGLEDTREPQSGSNILQIHKVSVSDVEYTTGTTLTNSHECATGFGHSGPLQNQVAPFSCAFCGKRYPRKNSLRSHMRLHVEGKRFSCPVCQKDFQWKRDVVAHMRSHTGEKPFSCSVCGMRFARKEDLNRHLRVHTGEKPFSCSVCGKRFARNAHLKRHSAIHGVKTFP